MEVVVLGQKGVFTGFRNKDDIDEFIILEEGTKSEGRVTDGCEGAYSFGGKAV